MPTDNSLEEMRLPEGKTCADCGFFKRTCEWLINYTGEEGICDFHPCRFREPADAKGTDRP